MWCTCVLHAVNIILTLSLLDKSVLADLQYNPFTGEWAVSRSDEQDVDDVVQKLSTAKV